MSVEAYRIKEEITISAFKANVYTLGFGFPILIGLILPYLILWEPATFLSIKECLTKDWNATACWLPMLRLSKHGEEALGLLLLGVVVHELLHGITWAFFCKNGWKSIRFGIIWKVITPYAHCKEPLKVWPYRLGAVMPAIVLGLLPAFWGLMIGHSALFAFGVFFTWSAGGDFIMLWLTRHLTPEQLVQDHPDKIGCLILQ